jgi:hypothetical protein
MRPANVHPGGACAVPSVDDVETQIQDRVDGQDMIARLVTREDGVDQPAIKEVGKGVAEIFEAARIGLVAGNPAGRHARAFHVQEAGLARLRGRVDRDDDAPAVAGRPKAGPNGLAHLDGGVHNIRPRLLLGDEGRVADQPVVDGLAAQAAGGSTGGAPDQRPLATSLRPEDLREVVNDRRVIRDRDSRGANRNDCFLRDGSGRNLTYIMD